ncbi:MAG: hypothetical protein HC831_10450 [Chloroflexia bacterium]|nr:hypothetical protein [Chloroflexia bacterium]
MNFDKAKLIHNKFSNFLFCDAIAFIAPSKPDQLKSFLELARNHPGAYKSLVELLIDIRETDKILKENFSDSDFEIYVASRNFTGNSKPQSFREYIRMESIDFDLERYK